MHSLPRTYAVTDNNGSATINLGAPVTRALNADVGDTVLVTETDEGIDIQVVKE